MKILFIMIFSVLIFNEEIVQLKSGERIFIKDDYTWEYIKDKESQTISTEKFNSNPKIFLSDTKNSVNIDINDYKIDNNHLSLDYLITNSSGKSIVNLDININLYNSNGELVDKIKENMFKADKRLAETYLRDKNSESLSKDLKIPNNIKNISIEIENIEFR